MENLSRSTSQIVTEAASLLDEELAAGIVAARRMQDRFRRDRTVSSEDFQGALLKFQADAHEVVNLLNAQATGLQSGKNSELVKGLVTNVHNLLDLAVEMVNTGAELANQLIQKSPVKKDVVGGRRH